MEEFVNEELCKREETDWWFVSRLKIIRTLLDQFVFEKKNKILDVGCGSGGLLQMLSSYGSIIGIDNSPHLVNFNRRLKRKVILGDITHLNFPDNTFDLVMVLEVFEHLKNDNAGFKEVTRILKPNGILFLTVPAFTFLWGSHDIVAHHFRRYSKNDLKEKLRENGFKEIKITYFNSLLFPVVMFVRLIEKFFGFRKGKSDFLNYPKSINNILIKIFSFESNIIKHFNLPFGVSLLAVVKKI